jgi:regulator of sirC expression with transglutaminase-like and TPR domain
MEPDREIIALLTLADDPDNEVYETVAEKLLHYGKVIIPRLEQLWETTANEVLQERMELLIHRVHFNDLQQEFREWSLQSRPEILRGAILVAKYRFPDLNVAAILTQFEQIRKNVWLELNNYLSPLEQINVLNSMLYNYFKLQGHELTERDTKHFCINQVLESKQGNAYSIGVLYLAICNILDIPVFAIDIPRQFIFAYIDTLHSFFSRSELGVQQIQFYIDPTSGMAYTQSDIEMYLRKINAQSQPNFYEPLSTKKVIYKMLEEMSQCYRYAGDQHHADELQYLMKMIATDK